MFKKSVMYRTPLEQDLHTKLCGATAALNDTPVHVFEVDIRTLTIPSEFLQDQQQLKLRLTSAGRKMDYTHESQRSHEPSQCALLDFNKTAHILFEGERYLHVDLLQTSGLSFWPTTKTLARGKLSLLKNQVAGEERNVEVNLQKPGTPEVFGSLQVGISSQAVQLCSLGGPKALQQLRPAPFSPHALPSRPQKHEAMLIQAVHDKLSVRDKILQVNDKMNDSNLARSLADDWCWARPIIN